MLSQSLVAAKPHVISFFLGCNRRVWTVQQLATALARMQDEWQLPQRLDFDDFAKFLLAETTFVEVGLEFRSRPIRRYWWGAPTYYELANSLSEHGYLSHHSAMFLHDITAYEPEIIYYNIEQQNRGAHNATLRQDAIDRAFQKPARISQNCACYADKTICLISSKNTGNLGAIVRRHPEYGEVRYTNLPRTLVDIVVRPAYSGGTASVLQAYQSAQGQIAVEDILHILDEVQHVYPYHQAIGFYMERAGNWDASSLKLIHDLGLHYDFYLDYQMDMPRYSKEWRVYYPKELDEN